MPYLVAPASDFDGAGNLTTLANALYRPTATLTGLVNGTSYRTVALSSASPAFAPAAASGGFSVAGGTVGPFFWLPAGEAMGANNGQITFAFRGSFAAQDASRWLFAIGGSGVSLLLNLNRSLRMSVRDSAGTVVGAQADTSSALITLDTSTEIILSVDLVAGYARIWHNGTRVQNIALSAGTGMWGEGAFIGALSQTPAGSGIPTATVERLRIWRVATPEGTLPAASPICDVTGTAGTANAHPWKRGADAV